MELWIAFVLLYATQCVVRVPPGSMLFTRPLRRWCFTHRDGWRLTHPLPSAVSLFASRLPVQELHGRLLGRGAVRGLSGGALPSRPLFEPGGGASVSVRGSLVRVGGRPFAQATTKEGAAKLATRLRRLADPGSDPRAVLRSALAEGLRFTQLRERRDDLARHSRWLRVSSNVYAALLFVILPGVVAWRGAEAGLLFTLPVVGLLHVSTLVCFASAHRRLRPGHGGDLLETLFAAGLYPPLLLRSQQELANALLSGYHPAAVAAVVLEGEARRGFLRAELVTARHAAESGAGSEFDAAALESEALEGLCQELGEPLEALLAPPPRFDALATSYCPACHEPYRRSAGLCADCLLPLAPYPDDPVGA